MFQPWKTLGSEVLVKSDILTLQIRRRKSHATGHLGDFYTIDTPAWVNVLALTSNDEMVLVRQYRHGIDGETVEIPGGLVDQGESPAEAAERELLEETGYHGDSPVRIGWVHANPALQNTVCHTFLIRNAQRISSQRLQQTEEISVQLSPAENIQTLIAEGTITHALVIAALLFYQESRNNKLDCG